jgi:hypothetical protein
MLTLGGGSGHMTAERDETHPARHAAARVRTPRRWGDARGMTGQSSKTIFKDFLRIIRQRQRRQDPCCLPGWPGRLLEQRAYRLRAEDNRTIDQVIEDDMADPAPRSAAGRPRPCANGPQPRRRSGLLFGRDLFLVRRHRPSVLGLN